MKKLLACVLAAMMALSLVGCALAEDAAPIKIGVLVPEATHGWVSGITYYAQECCKKLEAEGTAVTKLSVSSNAETMTTQIEEMIQWGAEVLILSPQWTGMEAPVQDAIDRGLVVVAFDVDVAAEGIYKVTGDNKSMGVASAKFIVEKIGTEGTVVMMPVPTAGSVNELRMQGFEETIKEIAPNLKLLEYANAVFSQEEGLKVMSDVLTANGQVDAVFSLDDETSMGVLQALTEAGRKDVKAITGGGGCQAYFAAIKENSEIACGSALYSPSMIEDCFRVALAVKAGEAVDPVVVIPSTIVDASNVDSYLDPNNTVY